MDTASNRTGDAVSAAQALALAELTKQVEDLQAKLLTAQTQLQQKEHECAELAEKLSACMEFVPVCPITQGPMRDPILCTVDSRVYEKVALEQWLQLSPTSPMTRAPIDCSLSRTLVKYTPKDICDTIDGLHRCIKHVVSSLHDERYAKRIAGYTGFGELRDKNGNVIYQGNWKNGYYHTDPIYGYPQFGKPDGTPAVLYYPSGAVKYTGGFYEGKYHWRGRENHPNGTTKFRGEFYNGLLQESDDSAGEEYYDNGQLRYVGNFEQGVPDGYCTEYHRDGDLRCAGYFKNGHFVEAAECPY